MKRADFSAEEWEQRVLRLLSAHPDTLSVTDVRHVTAERRGGADGIWNIRQHDRELEIPFIIAIAAPGTHEVRFELAELHGPESAPGSALSEVVQLVFVCSPESHSMLTIPAHELRQILGGRKEYPRSVTQVGERDVRGVRLSERALVPLADLAALPGATVSTPDSW